ncbi:MAG: hypothetical protein KKA60_05375 [Proteobacteria bacterium]|nr:hypothetical protein [Pseudomonadota bacterium]
MKDRNQAVPLVLATLACLVVLTVVFLEKVPLLGVILLPLDMYVGAFLVVRLLAPRAVKKRILYYLAHNGGQADLNLLLEYLVPNANTEPEAAEPNVRVVASILKDLENEGRVRVADNRVFKVQ